MENLSNFFHQLSRWEHKPVIRLAAKWSPKDRKTIAVDFKQAVDSSGLPPTQAVGLRSSAKP
jgi:hypothetical protein